jgi:hypothetical protein
MKKRLIGYFLLIVLATQVFPADGVHFWTKLIQGEEPITASSILAIEEEEVEQIQFKLKNIESNHSLYFETQNGIQLDQLVYSIISKMGKAIDRNDPILIPPPNPSV